VARLDTELVVRNLFDTRSKAKVAIESELIFCNGKLLNKPSQIVGNNDKIEVIGKVMPYVSRGGLKLEKAIRAFNIKFLDKVVLDIGSSTGGFSDCALQNGAKKVIAIDVGSMQMDKKLRDRKNMVLYEKTDFRTIDVAIAESAEIATIDVSFISVTKLISKVSEIKSLKEIVCLIKPQFEVGKEYADKFKGIIKSKKLHKEVIEKVLFCFKNIGFNCRGLTFSPIKGGSGNIEYLAYFGLNSGNFKYDIDSIIDEAFKQR
jgi:23S rRNA (cytidine1920-2'-O)/16S rRNA (cytidine1409-2'-O)-methyltransferase